MATKRTRTANLYERDGWYYVLRQLGGKQVWKSLKLRVEEDRSTYPQAKIAAAHTLADLAVYHLHGGRARELAARPFATLAELHTAYEKANAGRSDISPRSATRALATFKLICTEALGEHDPKHIRCDVVTVDLFRRFEAARIVAARAAAERDKLPKQEARLLVERAQNTVRSAAAKFKSVLQPALIETEPYRKLRLPEEAIFKIMRMRVAGKFHRYATELKPAIRAAIVEKLAATSNSDPALYFTLSLAWETGMRRDTIIHARWDWFTPQPDGTVLAEIGVAKADLYSIRLPASLWAEWQACRAGSPNPAATVDEKPTPYLLPGATPAEREAHVLRAIDFLRTAGVTAIKPMHELRKWHSMSVKAVHGREQAMLRLGQKPQGVNAKSYDGEKLESKLVLRME
jgi:integrase